MTSTAIRSESGGQTDHRVMGVFESGRYKIHFCVSSAAYSWVDAGESDRDCRYPVHPLFNNTQYWPAKDLAEIIVWHG